MNKNWYCIEAYDGMEHDVYLRLANAQLRVWRPVDVVRHKRRVSSHPTTTPVRLKRISRFGRYLFIRGAMTESFYDAVRTTPNVRRFVCAAGTQTPSIIPDELIEFYKTSNDPVIEKYSEFKVGQKIIIENGPLTNRAAIIKGVSKSSVLELELASNEIGGSARIVINAGHVRILGSSSQCFAPGYETIAMKNARMSPIVKL